MSECISISSQHNTQQYYMAGVEGGAHCVQRFPPTCWMIYKFTFYFHNVITLMVQRVSPQLESGNSRSLILIWLTLFRFNDATSHSTPVAAWDEGCHWKDMWGETFQSQDPQLTTTRSREETSDCWWRGRHGWESCQVPRQWSRQDTFWK